ncbi:MAG: hypothetical protein Q8P33_03205, partial [bacterium]|nr:hypothetical protein [bacterium]
MPKGPNQSTKPESLRSGAHKNPSQQLLKKQFEAGKRSRPTLESAGKTDQKTTASGLQIGTTDRRFEESQAQIGSQGVGLPYINLFGFPVELSALKLVPRETAQKAETAPFIFSEKQVRLGTANPDNPGFKALRETLKKKGYSVKSYYISKSSLRHILGFYENPIKESAPSAASVVLEE